jgi:hypothetical protein
MFQVPHVVFGHSHQAELVPLAGNRAYVNVGTWVPEAHDAYFVYFAITGDGPERTGQLWRWSKPKGEPEPFQA